MIITTLTICFAPILNDDIYFIVLDLNGNVDKKLIYKEDLGLWLVHSRGWLGYIENTTLGFLHI